MRFYGFPKGRPSPSWIFKNSNSYLPIRLRYQICVTVLNFTRSVDPLLRYGDFSIFQNGGRPPCCILKIAILNVLWHKECQCASPRQISSKLVKWLSRYCDLSVFQNGGPTILDFKKFKFLRAGMFERPNLRHCAKLHQDRSIRCWDMAIFRENPFSGLGAGRSDEYKKVDLTTKNMWSQNMTIFPLLFLFTFTTACTTVQAVMTGEVISYTWDAKCAWPGPDRHLQGPLV